PTASHTLEMTGTSQTLTAATPAAGSHVGRSSHGLPDAPEEVDEGHRGTADDRRPARHEDADLAPAREMRVRAVGAETPHDRRDDQGEDGQDQADGHDGADDDAQLLN